MAHRFYFGTQAPAVSPSAKGSFDVTSTNYYKLGVKADNFLAVSKNETSTTNDWDVQLGTWVSNPMHAYTFSSSDTVRWMARVSESNAAANMYYHVHIYVLTSSNTVRGTLLDNSIGATEFAVTTMTSLTEGAKPLTAVSMQEGDRIVVEMGYRAKNTVSTSYIGQMLAGGLPGSPDLPETNGSTSNSAGWIEFSGELSEQGDKYLVKSGNWNDPSVWASTSGGAGGAGVPTPQDNVYVDANYTVTLTADAEASTIYHTSGTLSLSSYKLSAVSFWSTGSNTRTVNLNSGHLYIDSPNDAIWLSGSNLNFNAGTSLVTIDSSGDEIDPGVFATLSKTFNDVVINLGYAGGTMFNITGSPTFNSLIIQSMNSAAHTVNFDDWAIITASRFVAVGSSTSNKLTVRSNTWAELFPYSPTPTMYGQFVNAENIIAYQWSTLGPPYIGSNSVDNIGDLLLQDPPKISTLVDPLTTAPGSNTNWTLSGTLTQVSTGIGGGGYQSSSSPATITSTDTYDLTESSWIVELISVGPGTASILLPEFTPNFPTGVYKISLSGTQLSYATWSGSSWGSPTNIGTVSDVNLYKSIRASIELYSGAQILSVGMIPNQPPTIALNSPANNANVSATPSFTFTGTDPEGNQLTYQIQIDTVNTFDSQEGA